MNKIFATVLFSLLVLVGAGWLFLGDDDKSATPVAVTKEAEEDTVKIIAFGDSLTAGYGLTESESYPAQLQAALLEKGYKVSVINSGVSGETSRGNLERASFIRSQNADIVILGIGGNDALRFLPVKEAKQNMSDTIDILQAGDQPPLIILLQMQAPLNSGLAYKREFDAIYEDIADEKDLILVPFITSELFLDRNNKIDDGVHYNKVGYQKAIELYILPALEKVLDK